MTSACDTATAALRPGETIPGPDRPGDARRNGHHLRAIFGPHTGRVLQFLISLRNLSPADMDSVTSAWTKVDPVDRALAWAHLVTAVNEEYRVTAAASAARRAAIDTARLLGRDDWAFWAAAWDAGAALAADDLAEGDHQTLTHPLGTVMPALNGQASAQTRPRRGPGVGGTEPGGR